MQILESNVAYGPCSHTTSASAVLFHMTHHLFFSPSANWFHVLSITYCKTFFKLAAGSPLPNRIPLFVRYLTVYIGGLCLLSSTHECVESLRFESIVSNWTDNDDFWRFFCIHDLHPNRVFKVSDPVPAYFENIASRLWPIRNKLKKKEPKCAMIFQKLFPTSSILRSLCKFSKSMRCVNLYPYPITGRY